MKHLMKCVIGFFKFTFLLFWLVAYAEMPLFCAETPRISDLMYYHDASGQEHRVKNMDDWQLKCTEIRAKMQEFFGPFPSRENLPPLNVRYLDTLTAPEYTRYTIRFTAAEGEEVPAYLYLPAKIVPEQKYPAMLALHPTSPIGKRVTDGDAKSDRAYGKELAQRGYVVIAPDYPGSGELSNYDFKNDRYQSGSMAGIFYHIRCVDVLEQLSCVDKERIGVIGHSLGGHNAMYVAAFEPRLKLIVSSCGWTELEYYDIGPAPNKEEFRGAGRLWSFAQERYTPLFRDKYHFNDDAIPFRYHEVIGLLAPRPFFSHSPINDSNFNVEGVRVGIEKAKEAYRFFKAENNLKVLYSDVGHNFGEARWEVYKWIDSIFHKDSTP
jgi:pimeloyl-ACP methyl ester carboxylesterase